MLSADLSKVNPFRSNNNILSPLLKDFFSNSDLNKSFRVDLS